MGGNAFQKHSPPLPTPRMLPEIYHKVLTDILSLLRGHYAHVDSPIDAPQKQSHGDIDILCTLPLDPEYDPAKSSNKEVAEKLGKTLGAKAWIVGEKDTASNFAIPWPADENETEQEKEERYIQLDIHVFNDYENYKWMLFQHAHSDLWNILGSTIRRYGLTVNNLGLFLRIPEIELHDKKKSMVFLSRLPVEVLSFLGLDEDKWWNEFDSEDELMEYAASCRFFWVEPKADGEGEREGSSEQDIGTAVPSVEGQIGGAEGKKKLKHNDRKRMAQRALFRRWIDEFIPKCREECRFPTERVTREQITLEACEKFSVSEEFETRKTAWFKLKHGEQIWRLIKETVPEGKLNRTAAIKELKRVVMEGEVEGWEDEKLEMVERNREGFWDVEGVRRWVEGNWKRAGEIGAVRQKKRGVEEMKKKTEKRAKVEGEREM